MVDRHKLLLRIRESKLKKHYLAQSAGVAWSTIARWFTGEIANPSEESMLKVLAVLDREEPCGVQKELENFEQSENE